MNNGWSNTENASIDAVPTAQPCLHGIKEEMAIHNSLVNAPTPTRLADWPYDIPLKGRGHTHLASAQVASEEFRRFLDIALGSLAELSYAILFAKELGYLSESDWKELDELRTVAGKLTWGFYRLISERGG